MRKLLNQMVRQSRWLVLGNARRRLKSARKWGLDCAVLFLALLTFGTWASADSKDDWAKMKGIRPRRYQCDYVVSPPAIDGRLNDGAWKNAPWTEAFIDIEGMAKPRPRLKTRIKMLWDATFLYVGADLEEPHVWGTLTKHDSVIFRDNDFEIFIDPDGDNHKYYELELNALNTTWDLFLPRPYKDGGKADNKWEIPNLKTAVHIEGTLNDPSDTDRGWSVEIAIPWKALDRHGGGGRAPHAGASWRLNFSRVQWRTDVKDGKYVKRPKLREDNWVWSPQGIIDMHRPERWGWVTFVNRTAAGRGAGRANAQSLAAVQKIRDRLMEVYHLQRSHKRQHQKYAKSLTELGIRTTEPFVTLKLDKDGYRAVLAVPNGLNKTGWIAVRQDSRLRDWHPVEAVLAEQVRSWNEGDIDGFMKTYWKSPQLTFSSTGTVTRGWQATAGSLQTAVFDSGQDGPLTVCQSGDDVPRFHGGLGARSLGIEAGRQTGWRHLQPGGAAD